MKIRFERGGVVFEYARQPMPERRFRALCALAAAGVYVSMVIAVAALCGLPGVIVIGVGTVLTLAIKEI